MGVIRVSLDPEDQGRTDSPKIAGSVAAKVSLASGVLLWLGGGFLLSKSPESGIGPLVWFLLLVPIIAIISAWVALVALVRESPPHKADRRWSVSFMVAMFVSCSVWRGSSSSLLAQAQAFDAGPSLSS